MFWTTKNSYVPLPVQVIIGLLLAVSLISQVNAVSSCFYCEFVGGDGDGVPCDKEEKQECPSQANSSCIKLKGQMKDMTGKWVSFELKKCDSKGPNDKDDPKDFCEELEPGIGDDQRGKKCYCFTDNCNEGSLPEWTEKSSSSPQLFTRSPQSISGMTFYVGGALLMACYHHLI